MPLFLCRWPDATVSIVKAKNREEAAMVLDEIASLSS
jgi:hypothetical protein